MFKHEDNLIFRQLTIIEIENKSLQNQNDNGGFYLENQDI
jgi:hypothetical protein